MGRDVGRNFDCVWLADWFDLCAVLLPSQPLCRLLPQLYRTDQPIGPWREVTLDLFAKYGEWKVNVLNCSRTMTRYVPYYYHNYVPYIIFKLNIPRGQF